MSSEHTKGARKSTWDKHTNRDKGLKQEKLRIIPIGLTVVNAPTQKETKNGKEIILKKTTSELITYKGKEV